MNIGVIGLGNMGSMIAGQILSADKDGHNRIFVWNRTDLKLDEFIKRFPSAVKCADPEEAAGQSDILFLCVKPAAAFEILSLIKDRIKKDCHLVSIAADVSIQNISSLFNGKITVMMPTVTAEAGRGVTICCHNSTVNSHDQLLIENLFGGLIRLEEIPENDFELITSLTSCGPGLCASLLMNFAAEASKHTSIPKNILEEYIVETMSGMLLLAQTKKMTLNDILGKVATKGGVTGRGAAVLDAALPEVFGSMLRETADCHAERKKLVDEMFARK